MKILDVGCGSNPYVAKENEVVITADIRVEVKPNVVCDIRELPFETNYFDMVRASHVLEHFGRNETHKVLDGWVRVLKIGGQLEIVVPNITWAAWKIVNTFTGLDNLEDEDTVISVLYGDQSYKENFHYIGFTEQTLRRELKLMNLDIKQISNEGYELKMTATKL